MLKRQADFPEDKAVLAQIEKSEPVVADVRLLNGARFLAAQFSGSPKAHVAVHFDAGSRREGAGEFGMLHFFEHLPPASFRLEHGTDLEQYAKVRQWDVGISISEEQLSFGFTCPDFDANDALAVLGRILRSTESYRRVFDVEKGRILDEINRASMNGEMVRWQVGNSLLLSGTGYDHPVAGYGGEVSRYTFDQVMAAGRRFLSAENATFAVSGSSELIQQAHTFFENLILPASGPRAGVRNFTPSQALTDLPLRSGFSWPLFPGVELCAYLQGVPAVRSPESTAFALIVEELSALLNSRLSHTSGLTYGARVTRRPYPQVGFVEVGLSCEPHKVAAANDCLVQTIAEFPGLISNTAIADYYRATRNRKYLQTKDGEASLLLSFLAQYPDVPHIPHTQLLNELRTLDLDFVREVAKRFLKQDTMRFAYLGTEQNLRRAGLM